MKGKEFCSYIRRIAIVIFLLLIINQTYSQVSDTLQQKPVHSPKKAAMMSATLPGLGQVYNKKYWKVPIVYGLGGYCFYRFQYNAGRYQDYEEAYADMVSGRIDQFENRFNEEDVKQVRDIYRRNRDLYVILMAGIYLANILDASVDAYLYDFDVSNDLKMSVRPTTIDTEITRPVLGLKLSLSF